MDLSGFKVKIDEPYVEIIDAKPCPKTVGVLKNLVSGTDGEIRALLQYFYQSRISKKLEREISKVLEEISVSEMRHAKLLSSAIVDFGGEPKYETAQGQYFSASVVNYTTKLREMLEGNMRGEQRAIDNYTQAIGRVENESLKKLFAQIIEDEKLHLKIFSYILDNVKFMSY